MLTLCVGLMLGSEYVPFRINCSLLCNHGSPETRVFVLVAFVRVNVERRGSGSARFWATMVQHNRPYC